MKVKNVKTTRKDSKIDDLVMADVGVEKAWDKETRVGAKTKPTSIRLNTRTIERAKFFARVHRERGYQSWLKKIVEERINSEYEMYRRLRKDVA